jgi:beta-galactosidase
MYFLKKITFTIALTLSIILNLHSSELKPDAKSHQFSFGGPKGRLFLLDQKPFQIRAAEIHPQRVPKIYWKHRIQMAKAMGLNTIAFYAFWNDFEQKDGTFDFKTGNRDIVSFIKECQKQKMWVLFRPGPYACGEWDFGGLPSYLLKDKDSKIRTLHDKTFMKAQTRYLKAIAKVVRPYLVQNGGPILMPQLENEFGSYARKHESKYMQWLKDFWTKEGFGPFYTSDGASNFHLKGVVLPGVAVGLDPGESDGHFAAAYRNNPGVPAFSSETYPGWLRHWGEGNWRPTNKTKKIEWFMKNKHSFNIFVFHGGTNFGFTAGANSTHRDTQKDSYKPDLTSYDYGAPCDEQGRATKEYKQYRNMIQKYRPEVKLPAIPAEIPSMEIASFLPKFVAPIRTLGQPYLKKQFKNPPYFEELDQNQGMAIYQAKIPAGPEAKLKYQFFHDYGHIFVDGKLIKTVDRRKDFDDKKKFVTIPARDKETTIEVWVEAMGHINFHVFMENDRKGFYGKVTLDGKPVENWRIKLIPLDAKNVMALKPSKKDQMPGGVFSATINLDKVADTFFDMSKYTKGTLYVNGVNLGRYWSIGPQLRLYCPASVLKKGKNNITIVELVKTRVGAIRGCKERNYNQDNKKTKNSNNVW